MADAPKNPTPEPDEELLLAELKSSLGTGLSRTAAGVRTWTVRGASTLTVDGHGAAGSPQRLPEVNFATDDWPIADYEPLRACGCGAFGEVWIVRDRAGLLRALKILDLRSVRRHHAAVRELEALRRYCALPVHPHLISIFHIGQTSDCLYYTMELADDAHTGRPLEKENLGTYTPTTLRALLQSDPPKRDRAIAITRELLSGLIHLHQADLAHRDIKPENIVFVGGSAMLADIGMTTEAEPRHVGGGTPGYMPPDFRSDATADTYALSKVLFEVLAWPEPVRVPWVPTALLDPDDLQAQRLNDVLVRGCAPNGDDRYADAGEMLAALDACLEPKAIAVEPEAVPSPRWRRRPPRVAVALLIVAAVVATAIHMWPEPPTLTHIDYVAAATHRNIDGQGRLFSLSRNEPLRPGDGLSLFFRTNAPAYVYVFCHTESNVDIVLYPPGPSVAHRITVADRFVSLDPPEWIPSPEEAALLEGVVKLYVVASATPLERLADAMRRQAEKPTSIVKPPRPYHVADKELREEFPKGTHGLVFDEPPPSPLRNLAHSLGTFQRPRQLLERAGGRDVIVRFIDFAFSTSRDAASPGGATSPTTAPTASGTDGSKAIEFSDE